MKKTIEFMECMTLQSTLHLSPDQRKALTHAITVCQESEELKKENEGLKESICPDGSITKTDELIDFAKDLQHAYDKLCDVEKVENELTAIKKEVERLKNENTNMRMGFR